MEGYDKLRPHGVVISDYNDGFGPYNYDLTRLQNYFFS